MSSSRRWWSATDAFVGAGCGARARLAGRRRRDPGRAVDGRSWSASSRRRAVGRFTVRAQRRGSTRSSGGCGPGRRGRVDPAQLHRGRRRPGAARVVSIADARRRRVPGVVGAARDRCRFAGLIAAACVGPVFVATVCAWSRRHAPSCCRRTPVGVHPRAPALGMRKWFADKLLETSLTITNSLYSTLYTVAVAAAARCPGRPRSRGLHRRAPRSGPADPRSGELRRRHGRGRRRDLPQRLGRLPADQRSGTRAFVGNAALLPSGTRLGAGSLIGVATVPPPAASRRAPRGSARRRCNLPARQVSGDFAEKLTYRPSRWRVARAARHRVLPDRRCPRR